MNDVNQIWSRMQELADVILDPMVWSSESSSLELAELTVKLRECMKNGDFPREVIPF